MLQKIIDNDERGDKARQEMTRVVAQHRVAVTKLREQERLTFTQEEGARVSENTCSRAHVLHTCRIGDCFLECCSVFCLRRAGGDGETEEGSDESYDGVGAAKGSFLKRLVVCFQSAFPQSGWKMRSHKL